jgi:quercetin dioxygenase-like cupin family protein
MPCSHRTPRRRRCPVVHVADEINDPRTGQRLVFRHTSDDVLEVDLFVSPGAFVRDHVHPTQEETFTGIDGTFALEVDGEKRTISPGDSVVISPRTRHGFEPVAEEAHLLVNVRPALELEGYFRGFLSLSRESRLRIPPRGLPKPLLLFAVLMHRYRREIAAPGVPIWLQRPLWRVLALLGRLRGYRVD